jgi:hypothetical protein
MTTSTQLQLHRHLAAIAWACLDRSARGMIRDIRARECEGSPTVVAAAGVELRGVVREGEEVFPEELFEPTPCCIELRLGLVGPLLRGEHVGKTPPNLRVAARNRRSEQRLRVACLDPR